MKAERGRLKPERGLLWNLYSGAVAAAAAVLTHKLVTAAWKSVTGEEPPQPTDPSVPTKEALAWVLASAVGIGVGQVLANRLAAERWEAFTGEPPPTTKHVSLKF